MIGMALQIISKAQMKLKVDSLLSELAVLGFNLVIRYQNPKVGTKEAQFGDFGK